MSNDVVNRARRLAVPFALTATLAAGALLGGATTASAQGFGGPGRGGMMFGGGPGGMASPLQSNPMGLLQRTEVQTHLRLTVQQKQQIADLQGQTRTMMGERMRSLFQGQQQPGGGNPSREERRQQFEQMRPQMEAAMNAFQGELNDKMKAILTPEQAARLRQLDLQRRGILSLADPKVAEEVKLSPANRAEVGKIVADWQQQTGEVTRTAFENARQSGQFPDFQSKLSPTKQKLDKIKKAAEAQVQALLSDEEKAAWASAQGEPFTFRADPVQQRPNFPGGGRPGAGRGRGVGA